jgi:Raf kinase inhibitor-like YbhB/YbcL family protein
VRQRSRSCEVGSKRAVQIATVSTLLGLAVALAACDTDDGKTLRPADPNATTTTTAAVASVGTGVLSSIVLDSSGNAGTDNGLGNGGFLPGDSIAANDLTDAGFELLLPWPDGGEIDARYTCDGDDVQPPVSWKSLPSGTAQLAFVMVDESSIDDGAPFVHWAIAGIDPAVGSIVEGQVPLGAVVASNGFRANGWRGPCPPEGNGPHTYTMTMYALNQQVEIADGTPAAEFIEYIEALSIGSTDLSFVYER